MQKIHKEVAKRIKEKNKKTAIYSNKKRKNRPQLKEGDKVYLLTKNIKSKRPSRKLDYIKVRPFLVKRQKGPVNYKLDLPKDTNIHLVFYILLLELVDTQTPLQETFYFEEEEEYEVDKILEKEGQKYLIRQKGCDKLEDTWEPYSSLVNCQNALQEFYRRQLGRLRTRNYLEQGGQFVQKRY